MSTELLPCPFCGDTHARVADRSDEDGCYWAFVRCDKCGVQTRGKWAGNRSDTCPIFYGEVRDEWNTRAAAPPASIRERTPEERAADKANMRAVHLSGLPAAPTQAAAKDTP